MSLDPALRTRIESLLAANRVVLFMKGRPDAPQCGFSAKAIGALEALGVDYAHVDVLADAEIREGIKAYGEWPTIPQLYIGGDLVGGSDIIQQMASSGELHGALGLPAPDRTPPRISVTPAAAEMLRKAIEDAGGDVVVKVEIDPQFRTRLNLAHADAAAITAESAGIRVQFDLAGARRAEGLSIDWADDERGRGLVIDNPNAPPKVQPIAPTPVRTLSPADAVTRLRTGTLTVVDVRPREERALASINEDFATLDEGLAPFESLPRDTALAVLCHHGGRSQQAAAWLARNGHPGVFNLRGGVEAWATDVDPTMRRY
jgi:monothiol glutaredoxin